MGGFASFEAANSALRHSQLVMETAANNVANVSTAGYARRRVLAETAGVAAPPALWSTPALEGGQGVRVSGIGRTSEPLAVARVRTESGSLSMLAARTASLDRLEAGLGEPGDSGVAAALGKVASAWMDVANTPDVVATRHQVLGALQTLIEGVGAQQRNIDNEQANLGIRVLTDVGEVNAAASDLASLNRAVAASAAGGPANPALADQRDALLLRLAELTGGKATIEGNGQASFAIGTQTLVQGTTAQSLSVASGLDADGKPTGGPVTLAMSVTGAATSFPAGALGGSLSMLNTDLPAYQQRLDDVAASLAQRVNTQHQAGYTSAGTSGAALLSFDPAAAARTLAVAITDPAALAVSSSAVASNDGANAAVLGSDHTIEDAYAAMVTSLGSAGSSAKRLEANQSAVVAQARQVEAATSGVNLDEEMLALQGAQRTYEAAARVLTVIDSVLDTLINRTGATR